MEKQQLLFEQSRLADRGAAEMVLLYISASRGQSRGGALEKKKVEFLFFFVQKYVYMHVIMFQ